jgi:hypothetical protein
LDRGLTVATVVLLIDQFEEFLGHEERNGVDAASRFLQLLRDAIDAQDDPPQVLGTMRSDYVGVLQRTPTLQGVYFRHFPSATSNRTSISNAHSVVSPIRFVRRSRSCTTVPERYAGSTLKTGQSGWSRRLPSKAVWDWIPRCWS